MKKRTLSALLIPLMLTGCTRLVPEETSVTRIYATVYPLYALTNAIADGCDNVTVSCLEAPTAGCMRSYSLSDWDIALLESAADGVLAFGSGFEADISALESLSETYFWLGETLSGQELYTFEDDPDAETDDHFTGTDPFVYLSVDGTEAITRSAASMLITLDPDNAAVYTENEEKLLQQISELKESVAKETEVCDGVRVGILNEALVYPAQDYGMECAVFVKRESGANLYDTELENCLTDLTEANVQAVLVETQAPKELTDAIENAGIAVIRLDVMSMYTDETDYFGTLRQNAENAAAVCRGLTEETN